MMYNAAVHYFKQQHIVFIVASCYTDTILPGVIFAHTISSVHNLYGLSSCHVVALLLHLSLSSRVNLVFFNLHSVWLLFSIWQFLLLITKTQKPKIDLYIFCVVVWICLKSSATVTLFACWFFIFHNETTGVWVCPVYRGQWLRALGSWWWRSWTWTGTQAERQEDPPRSL